MSGGSKIGDPSLTVTLHNAAATLPGTGGASVATWALDNGLMPRDAWVIVTNNGLEDVTFGNDTEGPAMLLIGGMPVCPLFDGREVVLSPGDSIASDVPEDAMGFSGNWSVKSALSSPGAISVTVTARPVLLHRWDPISTR